MCGAFLPESLMYFCFGEPMHFCSGVDTTTICRGELLTHHQAGGGGHGDPFTRSPEAVARDVWNGKVTAGAARTHYGVAVDESGAMNIAETEQLRLRRNRQIERE